MCRSPYVLATILGSCVAVTMLHRESGMAGMCHAMLPARSGEAVDGSGPFRYLDLALDHMVAWFGKHRVAPESLEVKVFGGADVLCRGGGGPPTVGSQNLRALKRLCQQHGLVATSSSLGGQVGLKLFFDTGTGDVLVRRLRAASVYRRSIASGWKAGGR